MKPNMSPCNLLSTAASIQAAVDYLARKGASFTRPTAPVLYGDVIILRKPVPEAEAAHLKPLTVSTP
jgi:hypothetical protein